MTTVDGRPSGPSPGSGSGAVPHLTPAERVASGKAARARATRDSQAEFSPGPERPDPVALLEEQASTRVPELVPIRYGRMAASPFGFYRGAALIMASDLAAEAHSGLHVQLCGDAHALNFGVFATPERNLVFDVNDFDETLPGPFEWDVKRLTASLVVGGRDRGFTRRQRRETVLACVGEYRGAMRGFAAGKNLDIWYAAMDEARVRSLSDGARETLDRTKAPQLVAKARTHDSLQAFDKLTTVVDGQRRFISTPPLVVPIDELYPDMDRQLAMDQLRAIERAYRRTLETDRRHLLEDFELVDVARKVVGVGSVGTRAWVLLLLGRDGADPLLLQVKEAQASVLQRFVGKSQYANQGQRVVAGQRLMQAASDIFLGWIRAEGIDGVKRDFYFRQLRDWKGSARIDSATPDTMAAYGRLCGWTLARAHARSGDRIAVASYLGKG